MASPNELTVLRTAMELGPVSKRKISSKMGVNTEYAGHLLQSLSKRGLLSANSPGKFELTTKGGDALLHHLHHLKGILTAKADGTTRQIDEVNKRIADYEYRVNRKFEEGLKTV